MSSSDPVTVIVFPIVTPLTSVTSVRNLPALARLKATAEWLSVARAPPAAIHANPVTSTIVVSWFFTAWPATVVEKRFLEGFARHSGNVLPSYSPSALQVTQRERCMHASMPARVIAPPGRVSQLLASNRLHATPSAKNCPAPRSARPPVDFSVEKDPRYVETSKVKFSKFGKFRSGANSATMQRVQHRSL